MRLALHEVGAAGPSVVLIHGIPGSSGVWADAARQLEGEHRVLTPDLLGFGDSDRPTTAKGLWADAQAEALAVALDAARVERACVVGHDFGGPVALSLATRRPDLVGALALLATNVFPDTPIPLPIRSVTWPLVGSTAGALLFSAPSLRLMLKRGTTRPLDDKVYLGDSRQRAAIGTIFAHALCNLAELYAAYEATLRRLEVPVLVGWGDSDPFFPVSQAERTARVAPHSQLRTYGGAGHFLPSERPDEIASDIRSLAAA